MNEDLNKTDESSAAKSDAEPAQTAQAEANSPTETTADAAVDNGNDSTPAQTGEASQTQPEASESSAATEAQPAATPTEPVKADSAVAAEVSGDATSAAQPVATPAKAGETTPGNIETVAPTSDPSAISDAPSPAAVEAQPSVSSEAAPAPAAEASEATEGEATTPAAEGAAAEGEAPKSREPEYNVDEIYPELIEAKKAHKTIEVEGVRRVRGGVLVQYKKMPMFLPTSHLSLKSNPSENELLTYLHKGFEVHVHEINEEDKSRVIVTRRRILRKDRLAELEIGAKVEGKVSSLTDFGAFVNIGGVDGMVHVSRISRRRVAHPSDVLKKGDSVTVVIKDVDVDKERISLSMRELEKDAWQGVEEAFPKGTVVKGTVRSLTDFGAYLELKPGIEGLIHISELSWARRLQHPSELISVGQELEALVLDASERNKKISLSYKQTQPNPWERISEEYPIGSERQAKVKELLERGVVVSLSDEVDAFLPKGKMDPDHRSKKTPFAVGDDLKVLIMDVVPDNHSLIVGMEGFDQRGDGDGGGGGYGGGGGRGRGRDGGGGGGRGRGRGGRRGGGGPSVNIPAGNKASGGGKVTLSELLTEEQKKKLFGDEAKSEAKAAKSAPASEAKPASDTNSDAAPAAEAKPADAAPAAEAKPADAAPAAEAKPEANEAAAQKSDESSSADADEKKA